jgi:hypothetical protein
MFDGTSRDFDFGKFAGTRTVWKKHIFIGYNAYNIKRKLLIAVQALQYMKETTALSNVAVHVGVVER